MKTTVFLILMLATGVNAAPLYRADAEGLSIVLFSDKCAVEEVKNLPKRAVWTENGKEIEGCWGLSHTGAVMFYFADKTVFDLPRQVFVTVQGA